MAERRAKRKTNEWGWRLGGLVLCAFFGLGVMAGMSARGPEMAGRLRPALDRWAGRLQGMHWGSADLAPAADAPIVLVSRKDGFYSLSTLGELRGPLASRRVADLPVLSGPAVSDAPGVEMLRYAELLVRTEAALSEVVSEMAIGRDHIATFYLARSPTEIKLDADEATTVLARAGALMRRWRSRHDPVVALDLTVPGQAIMRLREPVTVALAVSTHNPSVGRSDVAAVTLRSGKDRARR